MTPSQDAAYTSEADRDDNAAETAEEARHRREWADVDAASTGRAAAHADKDTADV